jgi:ribosomal protein L34E
VQMVRIDHMAEVNWGLFIEGIMAHLGHLGIFEKYQKLRKVPKRPYGCFLPPNCKI